MNTARPPVSVDEMAERLFSDTIYTTYSRAGEKAVPTLRLLQDELHGPQGRVIAKNAIDNAVAGFMQQGRVVNLGTTDDVYQKLSGHLDTFLTLPDEEKLTRYEQMREQRQNPGRKEAKY